MAFLVEGLDSRDLQTPQGLLINLQLRQAFEEGFGAVHACKNEPVVAGKVMQRRVQRLVRPRTPNFDEWDLKDFRTTRPQPSREGACLMAGTPHQDAKAPQFVVLAPSCGSASFHGSCGKGLFCL